MKSPSRNVGIMESDGMRNGSKTNARSSSTAMATGKKLRASSGEERRIRCPDQPGHGRDDDEHGAEIELLGHERPNRRRPDEDRQEVISERQEGRVGDGFRRYGRLAFRPEQPVVDYADQPHRHGEPGQNSDDLG